MLNVRNLLCFIGEGYYKLGECLKSYLFISKVQIYFSNKTQSYKNITFSSRYSHFPNWKKLISINMSFMFKWNLNYYNLGFYNHVKKPCISVSCLYIWIKYTQKCVGVFTICYCFSRMIAELWHITVSEQQKQMLNLLLIY